MTPPDERSREALEASDGEEVPVPQPEEVLGALLPGTGQGSEAPAAAPADRSGTPVVPDRSLDDTDTGWGERPPDDDEHFLRDVPPHWG